MNLALAMGIMIIAGFFGGRLAHRIKFPMITGYIIVGVLLSPSVFNILSSSTLDNLNVFTSIALGIIAYSIGGRLHLRAIHKIERSIFIIGIAQALGAFIVSAVAITLVAPFFLGMPDATLVKDYLPMGIIIGAIASATAPAAILALVREYRARGPMTTTLLSLVAFDDVVAIILFSIAIRVAPSMAAGAGEFSAFQTLLIPFLKVMGSIAIGTAFGYAIVYLSRLVKERSLLLVVVLGTIILCVGVSKLLDFSGILSNMTVGFIAYNRLKIGIREKTFNVIDDIEEVIFAMFFVLAGLHFNLDVIKTSGVLALFITVSRFAGKFLGVRAGATIAGSSNVVKKYLGFALLPKAGVSIGLGLLAEQAFPTFGPIIYTGILTSVIINELIAPPLVKYAIFKAGEQRAE
ncbi:cation:proton antiporter [Chloroflexota bacterium]